MGCKLMKRLIKIEGIENLPDNSIEEIKRIICGTHNGVCIEKYLDIRKE